MSSWGQVRVAIQGPEAELESILAKILDDSYLVTRYPQNLFSLAPKTEDEAFTEFKCERASDDRGRATMKLSYRTNHGASNALKWEDIATKHADAARRSLTKASP